MSQDDVAIFDDSLARCYADPRFLERFYEVFLAASPEAREKFANTDLAKQRRMLKASLVLMMLSAGEQPEGQVHMERIASVHSRHGHDIPAALYDVWLQSLLQVVTEFDPEADPEVIAAWRRVLTPGIEFMRSRHDAPPATR